MPTIKGFTAGSATARAFTATGSETKVFGPLLHVSDGAMFQIEIVKCPDRGRLTIIDLQRPTISLVAERDISTRDRISKSNGELFHSSHRSHVLQAFPRRHESSTESENRARRHDGSQLRGTGGGNRKSFSSPAVALNSPRSSNYRDNAVGPYNTAPFGKQVQSYLP